VRNEEARSGKRLLRKQTLTNSNELTSDRRIRYGSNAEEERLSGAATTGTILIKENMPLPEALRLETEPYAPGWRLVANLDGYKLDRVIHEAGWTSFSLAGEIKASVFGIDEQKAVRRAVARILTNPKSEKFNSLEIVHVESVPSKRFLAVRHITVFAHSRQIQESSLLRAKERRELVPRAELAATQMKA
jgi:hypothetical protein